MASFQWLAGAWGFLVAGVTLAGAIAASMHALLYKRDTRATVLWVTFIWFAPLAGAISYLLLGINRIKRRATSLRKSGPRLGRLGEGAWEGPLEIEPPGLRRHPQLRQLMRVVEDVVKEPLLPGNRIEPLFHGDAAYPSMLAAIEAAERSVALGAYIFDRDATGRRFVEALGAAVARGVEVRVLVDDTGVRYSLPTIVGPLRRAGVSVARFLPTLAPFRTFALNMRNHRKLLIVDGRVGFTGGMNLRAGNCTDAAGVRRISDLHFKVTGPVVAHLREVFADDWLFTTGERLEGDRWVAPLERTGEVFARGIADGPDEHLDRLRWTLIGALACAQRRVCIATPYFLPDAALISALNTAALRGVEVEVIVPENNNLPFVKWASTAHLWQVLERGCRVYSAPGPFDHSKVMTVDREWSLIGSANMDPRSLRLNFEFDVECYCDRLAGVLTDWFDGKRAEAHRITLEEVNGRSLPVRLRDGVARLATPFL